MRVRCARRRVDENPRIPFGGIEVEMRNQLLGSVLRTVVHERQHPESGKEYQCPFRRVVYRNRAQSVCQFHRSSRRFKIALTAEDAEEKQQLGKVLNGNIPGWRCITMKVGGTLRATTSLSTPISFPLTSFSSAP